MIDSIEELEISGIALAETAFVLISVYQVPRERTSDLLLDLVRKENISLTGLTKDLAILGLMMCRPSGRVSFADALIWAAARSSRAEVVYSFDQRFPNDGLEVRSRPLGRDSGSDYNPVIS